MSTSSPPPSQPNNNHTTTVIPGCSFILALLHCLRNKKRTTPSSDSDSNPPHPFSYSLLRRATNSFSTILGHGGFGPVYSGTLPSSGKPIAVKLMNSASLGAVGGQGEREYHNELFFASRLQSEHLVPAIGFSSDPKRRRFVLVYDLMKNGNLHDALLRNKSPELTIWKTRFSIILDVAKGIQYLHSCDPAIIHGDIKPSNILLDHSFSAKIADFGLARLKTFQFEISDYRRKEEFESDGAETESVNTSFEEYEEMVGVVGGGLKKSGYVKDYVMDWIGKEVKEERTKNDDLVGGSGKGEKSKMKKKLEWWESMDEGKRKGDLKKEKRRPVREWWKEEYSQELENKNKKKNKKKGGKNGDNWWKWERDHVHDHDDGGDGDVKKLSYKNRSRKERGSGDSWLSGELRRVSWNSYDSCNSGEIHKSGEISSTPSMRGTVFYVAPENGYSDVTEKSDVYSFGVLLLVVVSGRRPLQVNAGGSGDGFKHMSEFKRANLVSWARHCARNGKLLELVDPSVDLLVLDDKEQALLCIKVALLCLLKSPNRRPSMKEIVGMLSGELEPPQLPPEYSQSRFQFKNRKECL